MGSMEKKVQEFINPLDLSCEAQKDKIIKILIKVLKEQNQSIRYACAQSLYGLNKYHCSMTANHIELLEAVQIILNVNTEKG